MAQHRKRRKWKEFYITSFDELGRIDSAWQSCWDAFGDDKVLEVNDAIGFVRTNLSLRDCRDLFRFAHVCMPDYVTGIDEEGEEQV